MNSIRIGIVGLGNIGVAHANRLINREVNGAELTAVCDADRTRVQSYKGGIDVYETSSELIRSGNVDAVIISTPHFFHTSVGIDCLENGLHVLVEKPISVHKADCLRLIDAARRNRKCVFSAMFQMRAVPVYRKVKELIDSGELGAIHRICWITTDTFRSQTYYSSSGWRATWKGEGGGILMNQCPHTLDLFQWFFGLPSRVHGFCRFGRFHDIEVEDDVTAVMDFDDGKRAIFVATTGEAPGVNRLEIAADRGCLVVDGEGITYIRNETPASTFSRTTSSAFGSPDSRNIKIPVPEPEVATHTLITRNFVDAIRDGTPLIAPGEEGVASVELANAILLSTFNDQPVDLPMDPEAYKSALNERIQRSSTK